MRKLSFEENLRHRLNDSLHDTQKTIRKKLRPMQKELRKRMRKMPRMRRRDEGMSTEGVLLLSLGVVAGVAAGVYLAQKYGGFSAIGERIRSRFSEEHEPDEHDRHRYNGQGYDDEDEYDEYDYEEEGVDDFGELSPMEELEERVLEAYRNDPILSERAIDIGAIDEGIIELTGWVHAPEEATHAVTIARGTPGVETVVNRLAVRDEEDRYDDFADRYESGYDSSTESQWNGPQSGVRNPRYGKSSDDSDELEGYGQSPASPPPGGERDGSPTSPSGVPKADHVARPLDQGGTSQPPPRGD
jgi:hypothetical protein